MNPTQIMQRTFGIIRRTSEAEPSPREVAQERRQPSAAPLGAPDDEEQG